MWLDTLSRKGSAAIPYDDGEKSCWCDQERKYFSEEKVQAVATYWKAKQTEKEGKEDLRGMFMLTTKSKFQPGMVDAERKELPEDVFVSSGDTIRVSAVLIPYTAGGMKGIAAFSIYSANRYSF